MCVCVCVCVLCVCVCARVCILCREFSPLTGPKSKSENAHTHTIHTHFFESDCLSACQCGHPNFFLIFHLFVDTSQRTHTPSYSSVIFLSFSSLLLCCVVVVLPYDLCLVKSKNSRSKRPFFAHGVFINKKHCFPTLFVTMLYPTV